MPKISSFRMPHILRWSSREPCVLLGLEISTVLIRLGNRHVIRVTRSKRRQLSGKKSVCMKILQVEIRVNSSSKKDDKSYHAHSEGKTWQGHELCSGPLRALLQVMVILVTTSIGINRTTALKTFAGLDLQNRYQTKVDAIFWFRVSNLTGYLEVRPPVLLA